MTTRLIHIALLAVACLLLHSTNFGHEFLLDSTHGLLDNQYVRSLANIPHYFESPATLTVFRQNWDYRPVLQATYAFNYWISGYDMWSWHLFQIILHFICVTGLYLLCRRILTVFAPQEDRTLQDRIAFVAALIFAVHPYTSGVINYLWARSSLLTSAFLFYSILLYMPENGMKKKSGPGWGAVMLYTLALFTKVEAVAALGVYWLFEVIRQGIIRRQDQETTRADHRNNFSGGFIGDVARSLNAETLCRLWPFFAVTFFYTLIRVQIMPDFLAEARHSGDITPYVYFATQLTAWWYYILHWFAPVNLISDNLAYPVFRSILQPEVLLAISGWLVAAFFLAASYRIRPEYMFMSVAALALISPTSSFSPLAEMVNEHRPYMPLAVLSLVWITAAGRRLSTITAESTLSRLLAVSIFFIILAGMTTLSHERNKVYATSEKYWFDVVQKAPSARAHVNYGLELQRRGVSETAMHHFQKALEFAPRWHIIHINLAIGYENMGDKNRAQYHYNNAIKYEMYGSQSLEYRGNYYLRTRMYRQAVSDFEQSLDLSTTPYTVYKGIATGSAGSGDWQKSVLMTEKMCTLNSECENEIVAIATPFWSDNALFLPGIRYFQEIDAFLPDRWWIYQNIADLARKTGRTELERDARDKAQSLQNKSQPVID